MEGFGMAGITEADVAAAIGRIDEIIIREVVRTGASRPELRRALAMARGPADVAACSALPPRMQRLVDLLITCIDHPAAANQTFLVSDGEDLSTADLLRRLGRAMNRPARLLPVPPALLQAGAALLGKRDMAQRLLGNLQVDITHTRDTLGWTPPLSVDDGLRRAVAGLQTP
ncbi:hypothetical protein [Hydrogenophaga sp.]|uniref:hypothetical protein n=1 Tax=Hydrogenophaga sp. TaxID=1904254 RepID=UPI0025794C08|nr:hypothetical protein [Hydrogenophaga sp.]